MPVQGIVDNEIGLIAYLFTGTVLIEEIISAHKEVSKSVHQGKTYLEINLFDRDSRYHELELEGMSRLSQFIVDNFDRQNLIREKIVSIELSTEIEIINRLWLALVDSEDDFKSSYASFKSLEESCEWLGINLLAAKQLLQKIGYELG